MISSVRDYFKVIMKELGLEEWRKSLEADNIPKTLVKEVYHLRTDAINGVKQNQRAIEADYQVTVSFLKKGLRDEASGYEQGELLLQSLLRLAMSPAKRNANPLIQRVRFDQALPQAIGQSNDNLILYRVQFTVSVILDV